MKILQHVRLLINYKITHIAHCNVFHSLRYAHVRYVKSLFTNIQKQQNMLKIGVLFKKNTNFTGEYSKILRIQNAKYFRVLFLYEHKHTKRFSNLH